MTFKRRLENLKDHIPTEVKDFLVDVAKNNVGLDVYLGGGYLRDICMSLRPKDLDIFLSPSDKAPYWNGVEYIPARTMVTYRKGVDDITIQSDMKARGLQRLTGLFLTDAWSVSDVQYIVYSQPMCMESVANDFDMGICQIVYDPLTEELFYTDNFVKGHEQQVIECFHQYDEERTIARFNRMQAKYPHYKTVNKPEEAPKPKLALGGLTVSTTKRKDNSNSV